MPEETSIVPETAPVAVAVSDTPAAVPDRPEPVAASAVAPDAESGRQARRRRDRPTEPPAPEVPPAPERVDLHAFQKNPLAKLFELGASLGLRVGRQPVEAPVGFRHLQPLGATRDGFSSVTACWRSRATVMDSSATRFTVSCRSRTTSTCPRTSFGDSASKPGNFITAIARSPRDKESFLSIDTVLTIEGVEVDNGSRPSRSTSLTPLFPKDRIILENTKSKSVSTRVVDILAPLGKGQRALICAPPRGGKTILLKEIAVAIRKNHPEVELMVLLLDERPEEVTDFRETVDSIVYASTFDQMPDRHMQVAEIVIARAQRLVEHGRDVVVLLDSLTRLTRAYNNCGGGGSGGGGKARLTSGGVDPKALQRARKFFGAARNVEEGGSLTIVATALIETESRMDEVIFEEFKGTGNMELQLDREMVERRIFPAINMQRSGTRNDDRLYHPEEFRRVLGIRRQLAQLPAGEAMEVLVKNLRATQNNAELLLSGLRLS
jgi:transcription termination factor Rho